MRFRPLAVHGGWEKLCLNFLPVVAGIGEAERFDIFRRDRLTPNRVVRDDDDDIFPSNTAKLIQVCRNYEERNHCSAILKSTLFHLGNVPVFRPMSEPHFRT